MNANHAALLTQPLRCPTCNRLSTGEILTRNGIPTLLIRCHSRNQSRCVKREERRTSEMCPAHYVALDDNEGRRNGIHNDLPLLR